MLNKIKNMLLRSKKNSRGRGEEIVTEGEAEKTSNEMLRLLDEYSKIKVNPTQITGEDFDRAFEFIEKYEGSEQAKRLIEEMTNTDSDNLKGLSYESAVKILSKMPDHPGALPIVQGMYEIDKEYIKTLISDVLIFMLEIAPEHPEAKVLVQAIVEKNFTNAYNFITRNPEHSQTRRMIREMFRKDPNIAILLLQERMEHPQVGSIVDGIYTITLEDVAKLTPNAVIFILEVAPDHQYAESLINRLVHENYIKAFEFIKEHMEYPNADMMVEAICKRKPELKSLF